MTFENNTETFSTITPATKEFDSTLAANLFLIKIFIIYFHNPSLIIPEYVDNFKNSNFDVDSIQVPGIDFPPMAEFQKTKDNNYKLQLFFTLLKFKTSNNLFFKNFLEILVYPITQKAYPDGKSVCDFLDTSVRKHYLNIFSNPILLEIIYVYLDKVSKDGKFELNAIETIDSFFEGIDMSKTKFTQTGDLKARSRLVASFFFIAIQLLETEKAPSLYISKMNNKLTNGKIKKKILIK